MARVRVGVIGMGFGRFAHIPAFQAIPQATVVGVADRDVERARQVAEDYGLPRAFDSWQALIHDEAIDAVSIATPPPFHEEIALAALAAGKAVLCEKPLAMDAAQAERMLAAAEAAGVTHMVNFEFREIPAWRFTRALLRAGEIGPLRHANVTWIGGNWSDPARPWSWKADRAQGGGALSAMGVHVLDYLEWFLGPVRAVAAHLGTSVPLRPYESGGLRAVEAEDTFHLVLELESGAPVSVVVSTVARVGKGHHLEFYGAEKTLVLKSDDLQDYGAGFGVWMGAETLVPLPTPPELVYPAQQAFADGRIAPVASLARRFVESVAARRTDVEPSFRAGARAQCLLEAVRRAHEERRWIAVPAEVP